MLSQRERERVWTLSYRRVSKTFKQLALYSGSESPWTTAKLSSASAAAFLAAQSSLLKNSTKQGTKFFTTPPNDAAPVLTTLPIRARSADFALKLSHFSNFSNLGNILASLAGSGSGAASIAEAKHSAAPICAGKSGSVKSASERGFRNELNGGFVICEESAATELTQADRTDESGSRSRRVIEESILVKYGERVFPWVSERTAKRFTHCFRTGDLSEVSVEWMQERKVWNWFGSRVRAMDSSSDVAIDWVSRSESLVRHVKTRCLRLWAIT